MLWEAKLSCMCEPDGKSTVEVLEPETIAGIRAVLDGDGGRIEYEDICLNAGTLGSQHLSPAACLPGIISALRDGWLLEENREKWKEIPCVRMTFDQDGGHDGKIVSTIWLKEEDGTPLRGEISTDGKKILTAEFTEFEFCDTIKTHKNP